MGIFDKLASLFGGVVPTVEAYATPTVEPAAPAGGLSSPQMSFMDGVDGQVALSWKNYHGLTWGAASGYYSPYNGGAPGNEVSRDRALSSAVSRDLLTSNSTIATLVEDLTTRAVGNGLTLSAKPDPAVLGITAEEARSLSHQIERAWHRWAESALECDASGRHTLHQLAAASYRSYLLTGESVVALDWKRSRYAKTATKVKLLDSRQLDQSRTMQMDGGRAVQGVGFDKNGRLVGYWITPFSLGAVNNAPMSMFVPAYTSWGRVRVLHLFDLILPGQLRGLSPLIAALTPAHAKGTLREYTLAQAFVQSMMAATVESDLPNALKGLDSGDGGFPSFETSAPKGADPQAWLAARNVWYSERGISLNPGQVNHLAANDKLKLHRSESPNSTYDSFDRSMLREAAKAAGASYEDVSGDYSQTSFSASRLALDTPSRVNERRRKAITERFYQAVFRAWLEEACETGIVKLPKGAPAFWEQPDAYAQAVWRGKGKAVADPLKQAQADTLAVEQGFKTYEDVLGEQGFDLEDVIEQRKIEKKLFETAGLHYPVPRNRDDWQPEDDQPAKK